MKEITAGIYTWSWLSPRHGYNFNGYSFKSADGVIVIDPAIMQDGDLKEIEKLGIPAYIILTNKDHERLAYDMRDRFGGKIFINKQDAPLLKQQADHVFDDRDTLPGGLAAISVPDNKSPGETALLLPHGNGILFIGDAIIGWPTGEFSLLPSDKYKDPQRAKQGIRKLLEHEYDTVLVGDGEPVLQGGKEAINRLLKRENVHLTLPVR